jgi:hypothetical protein
MGSDRCTRAPDRQQVEFSPTIQADEQISPMIKAGDKYLADKKTDDAQRPTAPVLMRSVGLLPAPPASITPPLHWHAMSDPLPRS